HESAHVAGVAKTTGPGDQVEVHAHSAGPLEAQVAKDTVFVDDFHDVLVDVLQEGLVGELVGLHGSLRRKISDRCFLVSASIIGSAMERISAASDEDHQATMHSMTSMSCMVISGTFCQST